MSTRDWLVRTLAGAAVVGLLLGGCGGGGVGSGGTGMASGATQGTVSGFGSVIVDGERFDDGAVATFAETAPGVRSQTEARLGSRVELEADAGRVLELRVEAALVAAVERVEAGALVALGQTVRVNADAARGPVTQFGGGYAGLTSVRAGDAVEVHAFVVRTPLGHELQATRIERLAALPDYLKLSGPVRDVDAAGFGIGALRVLSAGAVVLPAGATLSEGRLVSVLAPAASLAGAALHAAQVRVRELGQSGEEVAVSGVIGGLQAGVARFDLAGTTIDAAAADLRPKGTVLADGLYVQARGRLRADGTLRAATVRVRDDRAEAELKGTVVGFDSATQRFQVRGVEVDASGAEFEGCPAGGLAQGQFVELQGRLGPTGVIARSVHCEDEPADAVVERQGVAGSVDPAARRFVLTLEGGGTLAVQWSELTYFEGMSAAELDGRRVEVEGRLADGVMQARKIEREPAGD